METSMDSEIKKRDISDIMEPFGKYQITQFLMTSVPLAFISMININYVFAVGDINYRCRIDECEDANSTAQFPTWWPDTNIDRCSTPVQRKGEEVCTNNSFTGELTSCKHWIYESNNTVVAELNLACEPWLSNMVGTIHFMGMLLSMIGSGWAADKFGRKPTIIFGLVAGSLGILKTFATTYYMYVIIEFLEAVLSGGCTASCMVLLVEITGQKYRLLAGMTIAYAIYFGEFLLACIAMFVPYWKNFIYVIYGPCVFFLFLIFIMNESPRWQIVNGRMEKAKKVIQQIADTNKISINNEELANIDEVTLKLKFNIINNEVKENWKHAFKSKEIIKRLFVICVCRFTCSLVYSGMMINSVWLPGDKHINFLLTTVMSFPGELLFLYLINKFGRKNPVLYGLITCGVFCIVSGFIPTRYLWIKLTTFWIGKVIISICFTGAITYSTELFPTSVRGLLIGLTAFCSRVGGMLAPLTPILNTVSEFLPFLIFGCFSIMTGLLICLTPETKDLPLLDTVEQLEKYNKSETQPESQLSTISLNRF